MGGQIYTSAMVEGLWNRLVPGGFMPIQSGEDAVKLFKDGEERTGLAFVFSGNVRIGELSSSGFTADLVSYDGKKELRIVKNAGSDQEIFSSLAANLLQLAFETREETSVSRFNLLTSRIRAWQKFMAVRAKKLDQKKQLGIFGELKVLEFLLAQGLKSQSFCEFWTGPLKGSHDFRISNSEFLEVKSSLHDKPFEIKVDSLQQLNFGPDENLYLAAVYCTNQEEGININELAENIKITLKNKLDVIEFESLLTAVGMNLEEKKENLYRFVCRSLLFYKADELPRITPSTVPGVIGAAYRIALTSETGEYWTEPLLPEEYITSLNERNQNDLS